MKLAAKITAVLVLGILVLLVIAEFITLQHENEQMQRDMEIDMEKLGRTITEIVCQFEATGGIDSAREIINHINGINKRRFAQIVFLDDDRLNRPSVPRQMLAFEEDVVSLPYPDKYGEPHLYTYVRYSSVTARPTALELSEPIEHTDRNNYYFAVHALTLMGSTTLLGAVLVVALGAAWVGRPLRQLIDKTRRIGQGDLSAPLKMHRRDEFGELAHALNSMCEQLQQAQEKIHDEAEARMAAQTQLRHVDRLRTVGRLAAGIAHELGTPLNVVSGRANLIASGQLDDEQARESAQAIKSEADRIAKIIRQLLDFARRSTPQRRETDLVQLSRQTADLLSPIAEKNGAKLVIGSVPESCSLEVDSAQIQQVLTNLMVNAFESTGDDGRVELKIDQLDKTPPEGIDAAPGQFVRVQVCDNGSGIPAEILDQLFEPFFTTKQVGQGTGLGLSIAYGIVQDHGGWIDVASNPGEGSVFSVYLPTEVATCQDES